MARAVLAIDQGTSGTTAIVLNSSGRLLSRAYQEIRQYYPRPGWVEHDPDEILRSVIATGRAAIRRSRLAAQSIVAVGITNQRETFVVWERRTGRPLGRAIVWQCRRSSDICRDLRGREGEIARHTGLIVDPYFSATKLKWLLDRNPAMRRRAGRGELCFGTIDTWLIFRLSHNTAFITDFTNASRTMLFDIERLKWNEAMLEMMNVPPEMMPGIIGSHGPIVEAAAGSFAPRPVPIAACVGDQQAALFGQGAVHAGHAKATYGTGAFLLMHTGHRMVRSRERLLTTVALDREGAPAYALEGSVFIAGAAVQWLRDELGVLRNAADSAALARRSRTIGPPYLVPAFAGLGAPWWDSEARGALLGITRGTNVADLARAALEAIGYQIADVLRAMERDTRRRITELRVDGGATANDYLMQFQADILGRRVRRPVIAEATALGAGMLAGLAVGLWKSSGELDALRRTQRVFRPVMRAPQREKLLAGWHRAVARVLTNNGLPIKA